MPGSAMKLIVRVLVAIVLLGVAGYAGWTMLAPSEAAVQPETVAVTRGTVETTVLASGALQASAVTSVGAEVSGRIQSLPVKLGDTVKQGDMIAQIDSVDQENAVRSAEASLANLQAQLQARQADLVSAQAALDRASTLSKQKLVSDADLQTATAGLASAQAAIASLNAQISQGQLAVESAKLDLERTKITAPVSGTVVAVLVTEGQTVSAQQSAPTLVKIADLDTMLIKAQISEADVTKVQPGQSATFTILGDPNNKMTATLLSVEPAPDAISSSDTGISDSSSAIYYNGLFSVANPDHKLRIAMTTQVSIVTASAEDALTLPASALGTPGRDGNYRVLVLDSSSGKAHPQQVTVGLNDNVTAEIKDGLNEGDLVVTSMAGAAGARASTGTGANGSSTRSSRRGAGGAGGLLGGGPPGL